MKKRREGGREGGRERRTYEWRKGSVIEGTERGKN